MKPNLIPVLQYDDARAASDWLVRALGLTSDHRGLRFGASPIIARPLAAASGAWRGVRQGTYVSTTGSSEGTIQDAEGHVWSFGSDDMGASTGEALIVPELRYRNLPAAKQWLQDEFGFEETFRVPGPDGTPSHIEMSLGNGTLFIGPRSTERGIFGDVSYFVDLIVDDPDRHYSIAKAAGANIVIEPRDTPFGARFYAVRDPEQMLWWISTYRPTKTQGGKRPSH